MLAQKKLRFSITGFWIMLIIAMDIKNYERDPVYLLTA